MFNLLSTCLLSSHDITHSMYEAGEPFTR